MVQEINATFIGLSQGALKEVNLRSLERWSTWGSLGPNREPGLSRPSAILAAPPAHECLDTLAEALLGIGS